MSVCVFVCVHSIVINLELVFYTDLITRNVQVRAPVTDETVSHSNYNNSVDITERKTSFTLMKRCKHPPENYKILHERKTKKTTFGNRHAVFCACPKSSEGAQVRR